MRFRVGYLVKITKSNIPVNLNVICTIIDADLDQNGYWVRSFIPIINAFGETVLDGYVDEDAVSKVSDLSILEKIIYGI